MPTGFKYVEELGLLNVGQWYYYVIEVYDVVQIRLMGYKKGHVVLLYF